MDAIVYTSNTGSTKRYAELLSQMIGLPAFALGDAKDKLSANAGIIYLGWIMASGVKGYSRTFASEDRARIMEFFMMRDDDAQELIKSPAIKKKLQHMSSAVRSVFDTSGWENVRWERLL